MKLELKSLQLTNFKGIKALTIPFGNTLSIFGDNGTGKTTIADAFLWLLFGKNSEDSKDFGIKTLKPDGSVIHKLDHEVCGELSVDGEPVTLKRCFREKWVKRRGESEPEFTGHETTFFVNDVPYQAKEFQAYVSNMVDENLFKMITNPAYFNSLPWTTRRGTLIKIAGDIKDQDIAGNNAGFIELLNDLAAQKKSLEDFKKELSAKKKKLKDELDLIPARIDEVTRMIPEEPDYSAVNKEIENLTKQIADIEKQIEDKTAISEAAFKAVESMQRERSEINGKLINIRTKIQSQAGVAKSLYDAEIGKIENQLRSAKDTKESIVTAIKNTDLKLSATEKQILELRTKWETENAKQVSIDESKFICPTCKRLFETDDIEAKKAELTANFNADKLTKLAAITSEGKQLNADLNGLKAKLETYRDQFITAENDFNSLTTELKNLTEKGFIPIDVDAELAANAEYKELTAKLEKLNTQSEPAKVDVSDLKTQRFNLNASLDTEKAKLTIKTTIEQSKSRVAELERQEKEYAQQISDLEKKEFTISNFVKAKIDSVTAKINGLFKLVQFKMFDTQINGAIVECCETMINGVPYSDLNNGGRINAGREIISVLNKYYGVYAPVFTDNAESVTALFPLECQTVNLVVSEKDKKLRIE